MLRASPDACTVGHFSMGNPSQFDALLFGRTSGLDVLVPAAMQIYLQARKHEDTQWAGSGRYAKIRIQSLILLDIARDAESRPSPNCLLDIRSSFTSAAAAVRLSLPSYSSPTSSRHHPYNLPPATWPLAAACHLPYAVGYAFAAASRFENAADSLSAMITTSLLPRKLSLASRKAGRSCGRSSLHERLFGAPTCSFADDILHAGGMWPPSPAGHFLR